MNKNTLLLVLVAPIALATGIFVQSLSSSPLEAEHSPLNFELPDVSGQNHNINEWQQKIRIINFWATWCPPCLKEIPSFIQLQQQYKNQNVQFIGIAIDEKEAVQEYLSSININYPILIAEDNGVSLSKQLGNFIGAVPFTVIVDQSGSIIHMHPGELSKEKILEILSPLIKHP